MRYPKNIILYTITISIFALFVPASAQTISLDNCPAEVDLYQHLNDQVYEKIEGLNANDQTLKIFSSTGDASGGWVRNPDLWINNNQSVDITGISRYNSRTGFSSGATAITPRHVYMAKHYHPIEGDTLYFITNNNEIVTRTIVDTEELSGTSFDTDIIIGELDSDLPSSITPLSIISDDDFENYLNSGIEDNNDEIPIIIAKKDNSLRIREMKKSVFFDVRDSRAEIPAMFWLDKYQGISVHEDVNSSFSGTLVGGDSGNPGFIIVGNKPVLLFSHHTPTSAWSTFYYLDHIQDAIDRLSSGYSIQELNLDCFDSRIVLKENAELSEDLLVFIDSVNGFSVGNIEVKTNIDNHDVFYHIVEGNDDGVFTINQETGEIVVADNTKISNITFPREIKAKVSSDVEGDENVSYEEYTVLLSSFPFFNFPNNSTLSINENLANSRVIYTLTATDYQDDVLEYSIVGGNDLGIFGVNSSTGQLYIADNSHLDYEEDSSHTLLLRIQEANTVDRLYSTISLNINVVDISYRFINNDLSPAYTATISENSSQNTIVAVVSAENQDEENLDSPFYSIVSGNEGGVFDINPFSGQVFVADASSLDANNIYSLSIGASGSEGSEPLASAVLNITVTSTGRPTATMRLPSVSLSAGSDVYLSVYLSSAYTLPIALSLEYSGGSATSSDFSIYPEEMIFLPGEVEKSFKISAINDSDTNGEVALLRLVDVLRFSPGERVTTSLVINSSQSANSGGGGGGGSPRVDKKKEDVINNPTKINAVEVLLVPSSPPTPSEPVTTPSPHNTQGPRDLEVGSTGSDVLALQKLLNYLGYTIALEGPGSIGNETEYFGELTKQALIKFQKDKNITPSIGYFGPITRGVLVGEMIKNINEQNSVV